ncbi:hypothetical protein [Methylobacterium haplocladii]|uniref:Uncharacterized protein n=1 Tax=Methylobacterium haplocladii TaxID=1176176 RepID=A0A512IWD0_9HYPH|nr:hypothetical protein [Methylobacterium haplocladii]GEP01909.1 hypothetical protein MHA02_42960 [Methylobacterium haplocladii]GLS61604.1 hypothetical protein GCM10007887_43430 [Methylobacterium haplocladii]
MSDITERLNELKAKVDTYTNVRAAELAAGVANANKARDVDNEADHDAALAAINEISGKLKIFSPSIRATAQLWCPCIGHGRRLKDGTSTK